jgi:hypothetical protein
MVAPLHQAIFMDWGSVVALDALGTVQHTATSVLTLSYTGITVGKGSNRALVVSINTGVVVTGLSLVWDAAGANQSLSLIGSSGTLQYLYGLVAPVSGNKTLTVSWTSPTALASVVASAWTGVNQTGGVASFANVTTLGPTTGTSAAVPVTGAVYDITIAGYGAHTASFTSVDHTQICIDNLYSGGGGSHASNYAAGASSVTLGAVLSVSQSWRAVGCDIVHA